MINECLDLQSISTITILIISSVTLYGLYTTEHRILRIFVQFVQDWFAFDLRWFGVNPIIWILYIVGFLDLFTCFNGKFTGLSGISSIPFGIIAMGLVLIGCLTRDKEIIERFPDEDVKKVQVRIWQYTNDIVATGFGLAFGTVALWGYLIHDEIIKYQLIIMSLIVPNLLSIAGRGFIHQSIIARYFIGFVRRSNNADISN